LLKKDGISVQTEMPFFLCYKKRRCNFFCVFKIKNAIFAPQNKKIVELNMTNKLKIVAAIVAALLLVATYFGYAYYRENYAANVPNKLAERYLYISKNTNFADLVTQMRKTGFLNDETSFLKVAAAEGYDKSPVRAGRFEISPNMGNKALVRLLKIGKQAPVRISFNNKRTMEDVAGYLGKNLEPDSAAFMQVFADPTYLKEKGYTTDNIMTAFISNTYEIFWTSEPKDVLARMMKEHTKFWNETRTAKAKKLGLTTAQAYIIASIVEKETLAASEKSRIAGVYLNRFLQGWKLEADPTVVFATKQFDLHRILKTHLATDSPYNTYMYVGLPPGPICMPQTSTLDATLNAERHQYMFFCAAPDNSGTHRFAETLAQHNANANVYHQWLTTQGRLANQK
jgi:UPF0755 protein